MRSPAGLQDCYSIADLRLLARRRLPRAIFEFFDGGAEDEITLRANTAAFDEWRWCPHVLRDVSLAIKLLIAEDQSQLAKIGFANSRLRQQQKAGRAAGFMRVVETSKEIVNITQDPSYLDWANFDAAPDGQRLLMVRKETAVAPPTHINVVLNWLDELTQKLPARTR